jgi:hypothetical protein
MLVPAPLGGAAHAGTALALSHGSFLKQKIKRVKVGASPRYPQPLEIRHFTMSNPHRCMTQAEYARYSGLDQSYISRLVTSSVIPLNRDGRINPEVADAARRQRIRPRVHSLTKAQHLAVQAPQPPRDRIDQQVNALVAAIDAQLRHVTQFVLIERLDEAQLRDFLCLEVKDVLKQWQKTGAAPRSPE